jgi:hypothetical protein
VFSVDGHTEVLAAGVGALRGGRAHGGDLLGERGGAVLPIVRISQKLSKFESILR